MSQYTAGQSGRIRVNTTTVYGIKNWRLDQTTAEIPIPHFESFTDTQFRTWPDFLLGLSGATGTAEGYFLSGTGSVAPGDFPTDSLITTGIDVTMALLFSKLPEWGFGVSAAITAFSSGTNVENQPATFNITFRIRGPVPLSAVVSGF